MASERSRRCFILPFAASARRMCSQANTSATHATTKLPESFRRFVQNVPNLLPARSAVRSIARIAHIAFSISTPRSPPIGVAESFAAWFSISNTAGKCIFAICWDVGFLQHSMIRASATSISTLSFPFRCIRRGNANADSIKRRFWRIWSAVRYRSDRKPCSNALATRLRKRRSIALNAWKICAAPSVYDAARTCENCACF